MKSMDALVQIMKKLRDPDSGCPWDVAQSHKSIAKYAVEEAYEVVDAIEREDPRDLQEELGDLLLQVVFHAQMAEEEETFTLEEVVQGIYYKMVERHPHVFGTSNAKTPKDVEVQWDQIKSKKTKHEFFLSSIPASFPALLKAEKMGKKCAQVGFDWETPEQIHEKIQEEWAELQEARQEQDAKHIEEEIGDYLFVIAQYVRKLGFEPETALQKANQKFTRRLKGVDGLAKAQGRTMNECSVEELEAFWDEVKKETSEA